MPPIPVRIGLVLLFGLAGGCVDAPGGAGPPDGTALVTEGPMPEIDIDGAASAFVLRPGVALPPPRAITWGGRGLTLRLVPQGGPLPYPPPPPLPGEVVQEVIYPNVVLIGGTEDPREAFVVQEVWCRGGYDPAASYAIPRPARHTTGEWVFDVGGSLCDRIPG